MTRSRRFAPAGAAPRDVTDVYAELLDVALEPSLLDLLVSHHQSGWCDRLTPVSKRRRMKGHPQ